MTTEERLAELKRKLRARKGMREYVDNCKAMEKEIERLEALLASVNK